MIPRRVYTARGICLSRYINRRSCPVLHGTADGTVLSTLALIRDGGDRSTGWGTLLRGRPGRRRRGDRPRPRGPPDDSPGAAGPWQGVAGSGLTRGPAGG